MSIDRRTHASTLALALLTIAILSFIAATLISSLGARYQSSYHSSSWQEALNASEAGVDKAMATLNYSIKSPSTAWASWTLADGKPSDAANAGTFPKFYKGTLLT